MNLNKQKSISRLYSIATFPEKGFNYLAIPKCGTTTMLWYLLDRPDLVDVKQVHHPRYVKYITPQDAMNNGLTTFATIREPFSRIRSMYKYMCDDIPIQDFVDRVISEDDKTTNLHFRSMTYYLNLIPDVSLAILENINQYDWLKELCCADKIISHNTTKSRNVMFSESQMLLLSDRYKQDIELYYGEVSKWST